VSNAGHAKSWSEDAYCARHLDRGAVHLVDSDIDRCIKGVRLRQQGLTNALWHAVAADTSTRTAMCERAYRRLSSNATR
jgi:hypothetical protein